MFAKLTDSLKREFSSIVSCGVRHMVSGSLFLLVSVIFLCAASVPLWTGRFRMFPGGAFSVFVCYFFSIIFCFICGFIISVSIFWRKRCGALCTKTALDVVISYLFRIFWLLLLFGGFSPLLALACLCASMVFIVFAIINTTKFSLLFSAILCICVVFSFFFLIFTLKFMFFN